MRIETRHVRYFIAVAEELHFRRAAERLHITQPSLSRAIQQLEHAVGVPLLTRTNRRVKLTVAGKVFLNSCNRSLKLLETAVHLARKADVGEHGHITFGYTDFAISGRLPEIIEQFHREYRYTTIELVHLFTDQQIDALHEGTIDFGVLTGPVTDRDISHYQIQNDQFIVILPESHPLTEYDVVPLSLLADEPMISGTTPYWNHYLRYLQDYCQMAGFKPNIVQEAYNSEGIFGLVAARMGIAIYPECARNYIRKGVVIRDIENKAIQIPTEIAWLSATESVLMKTFINFFQNRQQPRATR